MLEYLIILFGLMISSITIYYLFQLKKTASKSPANYNEYARTIVGGLIGGVLVLFAQEFKSVTPYTILDFMQYLFIFLLIISVLFLGSVSSGYMMEREQKASKKKKRRR